MVKAVCRFGIVGLVVSLLSVAALSASAQDLEEVKPGETIFDIQDNLIELGYSETEVITAFDVDYDFDFLKEIFKPLVISTIVIRNWEKFTRHIHFFMCFC
mgnify:CR=1 FL=1